jgi:hypothetical protein
MWRFPSGSVASDARVPRQMSTGGSWRPVRSKYFSLMIPPLL